MASRFIWNHESILLLISLYEEKPYLYKVNDSEYRNKTKREETLESIRQTIIARCPFAANQCLTITDIKKKVHGLRSQYLREKAKMKEELYNGTEVDKMYTPKLWCFQNLAFLDDSNLGRDLSYAEDYSEDIESKVSVSHSDQNSENTFFEETMEDIEEQKYILFPKNGQRPNGLKSAGMSINQDVVHLFSEASKLSTKREEEDDIDVFVKSVAAEMRKIENPRSRLRLKREIFTKIMDAQEIELSSD